jgi:outer membrane protein assembly factor BamB
MNIFKNRIVFSTMSVLLILSFAVSMIAIPTASAQTERVTFPFVDAIPKNAGVGQNVLINFGLLNQLNLDGDGWNVTLKITDPDGKVSEVTRMTWSTGTVGYGYTPTKEGNYTLQCIFENVTYAGNKYASSVSENFTLQAFSDWFKPWHPGHSMPTEYWSRPVDSQLREWNILMGSWLKGASATNHGSELYTLARYNAGPESAHILWSMPIGDTNGGLAGGDNQVAYQNGDAYEGKFAGAVIIAGVLYYNRGGTYNQASNIGGTVGSATNAQGQPQDPQNGANSGRQRNTIVAVDLHTGKTLWERSYNFGANNDARINMGQIVTWICLNNRGAFSLLWIGTSGSMYALEPKTGELVYNMTNVPAGTVYWGPNGEMLKYQAVNIGTTANPVWQLRQWNSSYVVTQGKIGMAESFGSQIQGVTYNANVRGWDLNITLPMNYLPGQTTTGTGANATVTPIIAFPEDKVVFGTSATQAINNGMGISLTGISISEEGSGSVLFNQRAWPAPKEWEGLVAGMQSNWVSYSQADQVGIFWVKETATSYAFDLDTGKYMWQTEPQIYADSWSDSPSYEKIIAYGKLYEASVGGIVYCYDIKDGNELWHYNVEDKYTESYLGNNWWVMITFITDGKVYLGPLEHSAQEPKPRGAPFLCLDAETGDLIWEIDGAFRQTRWGGRAIIGDSIIATMDTYDSQIYAIGKGPSSMTMTAPNVAVTAGTTALITGTVMDVSPGTKSDGAQLCFPNGVPVASDETQSEWMLHVYKQFAAPENFKGVEVSLYAWDGQSAESVPIGTTSTDVYGKYSLAWTPTKAGQYQIFAFFDGSASYYSSEAKADMYVSAAPEVVEVTTPPYGLYIALAAIAIIVAVVIVGLLLYMKINKR